MKKIEIYIFVHSELSYKFFIRNNPEIYKKCKFVWLGENVKIPQSIADNKENIIISCQLKDNIEKFNTFLTFTGWYSISKNFTLNLDLIGLFEYDVKFYTDPFNLKFNDNYSILGCVKRTFPDSMFLEKFDLSLVIMLRHVYEKVIKKQTFWAPTTNFIVPVDFLNRFVNWFYPKIESLKSMKNHAHFMERAINLVAWISDCYKIEINENLLYHYGCNSHQINL